MKVFVSWSGDRSRGVAHDFARWLEHVLRRVDTFVSTQDIDAGERWEATLTSELDASHHAVLCVTRENQAAPWLLYEAGALGKIVGRAKVIPYTIGFAPRELAIGPLSRFQGVEANIDGTWRLIQSLNASLTPPEDEAFVREAFDQWWPRLERLIDIASKSEVISDQPTQPTEREVLLELRTDMRRLMALVRESRAERPAEDPGAASAVDNLTGTLSRSMLKHRLQDFDDSAQPYVVAMIDIDHLKAINDRYGHVVGDRVVRDAAMHLNATVGARGYVARYGGDEFVVVLPSVSVNEAIELLLPYVETPMTIDVGSDRLKYTASVGVGSAGTTFDQKQREAEIALVEAKLTGRAHVIGR